MKTVVVVLCVFLGVLIFYGLMNQASDTDPSIRNMNDFEAAWNRIDDVYPFFDYKNIDWGSIYTVYRKRVEAAGADDFLPILHDLLAKLKDGHVYYRPERGHWQIPYRSPRRIAADDAFSFPVVKTHFDKELRVTKQGGAFFEILPGNLGYLFLASMNESDIADEFPSIMDYFKITQGLIIDIRTRKGGDIQNVRAVVARFLTAPCALPDYYFLGELYPMDPIQPKEPTYTQPVVVLTNALTFSAGESTTEILKQLPHVTVIGDTTGGGGGTASDHSTETSGNFGLPSGIVINIPTGYGLRYDGQHFEWQGVSPDIHIEQTAADVSDGRDKQLEYAIDFLK